MAATRATLMSLMDFRFQGIPHDGAFSRQNLTRWYWAKWASNRHPARHSRAIEPPLVPHLLLTNPRSDAVYYAIRLTTRSASLQSP